MKPFLPLVAASIIVGACGGCYSTVAKNDTPEATFPVITVSSIDTTLEKEYVTQVQSVKNVEIRSLAHGIIQKIYVDEGQYVQEGQLLFQLNSAKYKTEVEKTEALVGSAVAESRAAEVEVRRVKTLSDKNIISKTELELAEAKYKIAMAKIAEAKAGETNAKLFLSQTAVRAPFSGVINRLPLKLGSLVEEGTLLTTISDLKEMFAYFNLSEKEYLQYKNASKNDEAQHSEQVHLLLADGTRFANPGKIETQETEINQSTGSIAFRARFDNKDGLLKHGSTGKILLTTGSDNVVQIPQKSVFEVQDKNYVYVLTPKNTVEIRSINIATRLKNSYLVKDGLKSGEKIIYEGNQSLIEGQAIKTKLLSASEL
jgi:membrane fusion protein (multidrug efflux system)